MTVATKKSLALNKRFTQVMPTGTVGAVGQAEINSLLPSALPMGWDWSSVITGKGEYVGTIGKRIAKYFKKTFDTKLTSDLLGKIGSIAGLHTDKAKSYHFDFTDSFDWESGKFGDDGSCYWTCRVGGRKGLEESGGRAVRFYETADSPDDYDSEDFDGYARAWVAPHKNGYVIFNAYGHELPTIARIVATHIGGSYRKIDLSNKGNTTGLLWINGGNGYFVGDESVVANVTSIDLKIDCTDHTCCSCGCEVDEDDGYSCNDGPLCESCYCDNYFTCEHCGEVCHFDGSVSINDCLYCEHCADSHFYKCSDCGEWFESTTTVGRKEYCEDCLMNNCSTCEDCDEWHENDDLHNVGDKTLCEPELFIK